MILGDVIGEMVSTEKHRSLHAVRHLIVQPLTPEGKRDGETLVAIDTVDAGRGDRVLVNQEGHAAESILGMKGIPVRSLIVAVVVEVRLGGETAYRKGEIR